jgi:ABC-type polysaccharide/polyol phosphate transport system ATPase subunit
VSPYHTSYSSVRAANSLAGLHWERHGAASCSFKMISFSNINGQYGKQLLCVDASFQLNPGEKVGLVGSNGFRHCAFCEALSDTP